MARPAKVWLLVGSALLLAGVAAVIAGWLAGPSYYLRRVRHGQHTSGYFFEKIGPRALPLIQREIHALGATRSTYRTALVRAVVDIRHDIVAERIGSVVTWDVAAALVEPDPVVVDALRTAIAREPSAEERGSMFYAASGLDFNTRVDLFCSAIQAVKPAHRGELLGLLGSSVSDATEKVHRPRDDDPWKGRPEAELEPLRVRMRQKLSCVPSVLKDLIQTSLPSWKDGCPLWRNQAMDVLAAFGPLPADLVSGLTGVFSAAGPTCDLVERLLSVHEGTGKTRQEAAETLYRSLAPRSAGRSSMGFWAGRAGTKLDPERFFCNAYRPERGLAGGSPLMLGFKVAPTSNPCVGSTFMQVYERSLLDSPDDTNGETLRRFDADARFIRDELSRMKAWDPRVASWAAALRARIPEGNRRYLDAFLETRGAKSSKKRNP